MMRNIELLSILEWPCLVAVQVLDPDDAYLIEQAWDVLHRRQYICCGGDRDERRAKSFRTDFFAAWCCLCRGHKGTAVNCHEASRVIRHQKRRRTLFDWLRHHYVITGDLIYPDFLSVSYRLILYDTEAILNLNASTLGLLCSHRSPPRSLLHPAFVANRLALVSDSKILNPSPTRLSWMSRLSSSRKKSRRGRLLQTRREWGWSWCKGSLRVSTCVLDVMRV